MDVLEFETRKSVKELMQEDLSKLGLLILSIVSRVNIKSPVSAQADQARLLLKQRMPEDLNRLTEALLKTAIGITDVCRFCSEHMMDELDMSNANVDSYHSNLRCEYENGRLMRLLLKLGFVNERPEYIASPQWGDTGDRHILRLFRDFVFHQRMGDGAPILDAGHVISCLNKLDAADPERIALSSRDGRDLLLVSYADIANCLEKSFTDLNMLSERADSTLHSLLQESGRLHAQAHGQLGSGGSNRGRGRDMPLGRSGSGGGPRQPRTDRDRDDRRRGPFIPPSGGGGQMYGDGHGHLSRGHTYPIASSSFPERSAVQGKSQSQSQSHDQGSLERHHQQLGHQQMSGADLSLAFAPQAPLQRASSNPIPGSGHGYGQGGSDNAGPGLGMPPPYQPDYESQGQGHGQGHGPGQGVVHQAQGNPTGQAPIFQPPGHPTNPMGMDYFAPSGSGGRLRASGEYSAVIRGRRGGYRGRGGY